MVLHSCIKEVAQLVLQLHHQHRPRGWTLSTETGARLLLARSAAPVLRLDGRTHRDSVRAAGTSEVGVVSQPRALGDPRAHSWRVNVLSASCATYSCTVRVSQVLIRIPLSIGIVVLTRGPLSIDNIIDNTWGI